MTERDKQDRRAWRDQRPEGLEEPGRSLPMHQPPAGGLPSYEGSGGRREKVELETSEWIAVLVALIPGVGQILLGQTVKGLVLLGISLILCFGGGLFSVASMIDAYLVATAKKRREVGDWEFFPDFQSTF